MHFNYLKALFDDRYKVFIPRKDGGVNTDDEAGSITVLQGGCYTIVVQRSLNPLSGENEDGVIRFTFKFENRGIV
jgi:hypothetical protein